MSTDPQSDFDALLTRGPWVIRRVEIDNTADDLRLTIEAAAAAGNTAALRFTGVTGLEFRQESGDLPLGLQIVDMAGDGWEGIRWKVTDPEYGIASFWSENFSIDAT